VDYVLESHEGRIESSARALASSALSTLTPESHEGRIERRQLTSRAICGSVFHVPESHEGRIESTNVLTKASSTTEESHEGRIESIRYVDLVAI